jgi:hypothetical protein
MPKPKEKGDETEVPGVRTKDDTLDADTPGAGDRPAPGSVAALQQRQNRLVHGHPSSRYNSDGTLKSPLVPLDSLELPLPGEKRAPNGAAKPEAAVPPVGDHAAAVESVGDHAAAVQPVGDHAAAVQPVGDHAAAVESVGDHAAPAQPAGDHAAAAKADDAVPGNDPEADVHDPADPDRQSVQEAISDQWPAAGTVPGQSSQIYDQRAAEEYEPAARDEEPAPGRAADLDDDEPATQDQPAIVDDQAPPPVEQPRPGPGEGLTREQVRIAVRTLGQCRLAEGRSVFGGYGENGLTPAMRRIEGQLEHGNLVPETEKYALKGLDRFQEKLAKLINRNPDKSADELAHEIHDGVRYTLVFEENRYYDGIWEAHSKLEEQGFDLEFRRNTWRDPEYKGINSRWHDPAQNVVFEVQFHTMASWDAKQRTHDDYEKISDTNTPRAERKRLRTAQKEVSAAVPLPPRCTEIPDYRKEG